MDCYRSVAESVDPARGILHFVSCANKQRNSLWFVQADSTHPLPREVVLASYHVRIFQYHRRLLFAFVFLFFAFCGLPLAFSVFFVLWCASLIGMLASSNDALLSSSFGRTPSTKANTW